MRPPHDILCEIWDAVAARHPASLVPLSVLDRETRELARKRWFRVLRVGGARSRATADFPVLSVDRLEELLASPRRGELRWVRRLHVRGARAALLEAALEACPRLEALWIDHRAPLRLAGLASLAHLRELTVPSALLTRGGPFRGATLERVTHLHLAPFVPVHSVDLPALAAFPGLTHFGFAEEPHGCCVRRVVESRPSLGVLVRVERDADGSPPPRRFYVHRRIVYLDRTVLDADQDWLKRACPAWLPECGLAWDQWTLFDAVIAARAHGRLLRTLSVPISDDADVRPALQHPVGMTNRVQDHLADLSVVLSR